MGTNSEISHQRARPFQVSGENLLGCTERACPHVTLFSSTPLKTKTTHTHCGFHPTSRRCFPHQPLQTASWAFIQATQGKPPSNQKPLPSRAVWKPRCGLVACARLPPMAWACAQFRRDPRWGKTAVESLPIHNNFGKNPNPQRTTNLKLPQPRPGAHRATRSAAPASSSGSGAPRAAWAARRTSCEAARRAWCGLGRRGKLVPPQQIPRSSWKSAPFNLQLLKDPVKNLRKHVQQW